MVSDDFSNSSNNIFYVSFHPILQNGLNTRHIKVKASENIDITSTLIGEETSLNHETAVRGDSVYSQTITYEANKLTFKTNDSFSLNTASYDFGELKYDKEKFYFYENKYTLSKSTTHDPDGDGVYESKEYLTSISGYFPTGRQIVVERNFDTTSTNSHGNDYAFQSAFTPARKV